MQLLLLFQKDEWKLIFFFVPFVVHKKPLIGKPCPNHFVNKSLKIAQHNYSLRISSLATPSFPTRESKYTPSGRSDKSIRTRSGLRMLMLLSSCP